MAARAAALPRRIRGHGCYLFRRTYHELPHFCLYTTLLLHHCLPTAALPSCNVPSRTTLLQTFCVGFTHDAILPARCGLPGCPSLFYVCDDRFCWTFFSVRCTHLVPGADARTFPPPYRTGRWWWTGCRYHSRWCWGGITQAHAGIYHHRGRRCHIAVPFPTTMLPVTPTFSHHHRWPATTCHRLPPTYLLPPTPSRLYATLLPLTYLPLVLPLTVPELHPCGDSTTTAFSADADVAVGRSALPARRCDFASFCCAHRHTGRLWDVTHSYLCFSVYTVLRRLTPPARTELLPFLRDHLLSTPVVVADVRRTACHTTRPSLTPPATCCRLPTTTLTRTHTLSLPTLHYTLHACARRTPHHHVASWCRQRLLMPLHRLYTPLLTAHHTGAAQLAFVRSPPVLNTAAPSQAFSTLLLPYFSGSLRITPTSLRTP